MIHKSVRILAILGCITFPMTRTPASPPTVSIFSTSGQLHEFPLIKGPLDEDLKGMPLLEGTVAFQGAQSSPLNGLPSDLFDIEFTSIALSPDHSLLGIKGNDPDGGVRYYFDRNGNLDLSDDLPVHLAPQGDMRAARVPLQYAVILNGENTLKQIELILYERKPGRIEYHFNERWESTLAFGGETLNIALQRWPILFIDANFSGSYDRIFSTEREVLALGGKFFRVRPDFLSEKVILEETDRVPVDQGFPAPDFTAALWQSTKTFRLTDQKGRLTVLTFWSPLCSGSRAEAPLFSRMAEAYGSASSLTFLAVTNDEPALAGYLKDHPHRFQHAVDPVLWELYGVTAPFVTFLIDQEGMILKRCFQFSSQIEVEIDRWLEKQHREINLDTRRHPQKPLSQEHPQNQTHVPQSGYVISDSSVMQDHLTSMEMESAVQVHFLGTCGFLISGSGRTILVDALYRHPKIAMVRTPDDVFEKMLAREAPFQHVDLVLVSHNHSDHFTTDVAFPFLLQHQETRMVANRHTISLAQEQDPETFEKVKPQIVDQTPEWGVVLSVLVNEVPLKTYLVSHSTEAKPEEREYVVSHFLVELEGLRMLHMGDTYHEANIEYFRGFGLADESIDIVFAETWDYDAGRKVMTEYIKPRLYVVMHNRFGDDTLHRRMLKAFPHTVGFTEPMERKIFLKR